MKDPVMTHVRRWRETNHLDRAVNTAGGRDAFDVAIERMLDEARAWQPSLGSDRDGQA
jgi:hypothetical protein